MNERLQPTQNIVELQGLLVNNTLEVKTDKNGRKFIGGTLEVNTGTEMDECIIPIRSIFIGGIFCKYRIHCVRSRNVRQVP